MGNFLANRAKSEAALLQASSSSCKLLYTMPTELPYAADAEVSLSFDELEVSVHMRRYIQ